jgi:predicted O-methyltransferase YrrM
MSQYPTPVTKELAEYMFKHFSSEDDFLRNLNKKAAEKGMPTISISPEQGAFIQTFLLAMNAKNVLEIGSLAGYSAITMARALPSDSMLISLEIEPDYAEFIRKNAEEAGLSDIITVINTEAVPFLKQYKPEFKFDFIFIDADKSSYPEYFRLCTPLLRIGGVIAIDNALAWGFVFEENPTFEPYNVSPIREFNRILSEDKRFKSCMVPVGDGMAMGVKLKD